VGSFGLDLFFACVYPNAPAPLLNRFYAVSLVSWLHMRGACFLYCPFVCPASATQSGELSLYLSLQMGQVDYLYFILFQDFLSHLVI